MKSVNEGKRDKVQSTVRIPTEVHAKLIVLAKNKGKSVNSIVAELINKTFEIPSVEKPKK